MGSPGLALAAIACAAIACGGADPGAAGPGHFAAAKATSLFPLAPGSRWRYRTPQGEVEVVAQASGAGTSGLVTLVSSGAVEREDALLTAGPFTFLLARHEGARDTRFIPFALAGFAQPVGDDTRLELHYAAVSGDSQQAVDELWRVRSTKARVEVPAGTFTGVTELERTTAAGTWISDWAPGIGKLREVGPDGEVDLIDWGAPPSPGSPAPCSAPLCQR